MPKIKPKGYLSEYTYKKSAKKNRTKVKKLPHKLFFGAIIFVTLFILVFFANIFSNIITPGRIQLNRGEKIAKEHYIYAVELNNFDNIQQANDTSEGYKEQLAAGYVLNDNGTYRILASMYQTRSNAESVVENLKENDINGAIIPIKLPALYLNLTLNKEEVDKVKQIMKTWYDAYVALYDLSVKLDKGEITVEQSQVELEQLKSNFETIINEFYNKFEVVKDSELIYIKIYLNMFLDKLSELTTLDTTSSTYSSNIKLGYFLIVTDYLNLLTELAKN
jgi:hypothetical protein